MSITPTAHISERKTITSAAALSVASSSFTPVADARLTVEILLINGTSTNVSGGVSSVSGGGLTWAKRAQVGDTDIFNYSFTHEIWDALVGSSPSSMTVGITAAGTSASDPAQCTIHIFSQAGVDTTTPTGATATGNPRTIGAVSLTLSAAPATTSLVVASRGATPDNTTSLTATPGTGWTELLESPAGSGGYGDLEIQTRTGSTSTSVDWNAYVDQAITLDLSAALAVEYRASTIVYPTILNQLIADVVYGQGPDNLTTSAFTSTAGSLLLVGCDTWQYHNGDTRDQTAPTDSKSNTYALIGTASTPTNWPTAGEGVYSNVGGSRGASHTINKIFQSNSECTVSVLEIANAGSISDYTTFHIADPSTTNPLLSLGNVHASGPGLLVVEFYGDQYGTAASTASGWTLIHEFLATASSIHHATFVRTVTASGDYACAVQMTGITQGGTANSFLVNNASGAGSAFAAISAANLQRKRVLLPPIFRG